MKQVILRALHVLSLGLPLPGCMTMISQGAYWSDSRGDSWKFLSLPRLWVYGGAGNDVGGIVVCVSRGDAAAILCLLDLPFSLAADTVLLPLTICQQIASIGSDKPTRENREDEPPPEEASEPEAGATSPGPSSSSPIPPSGSAP